MSVCLCLCWFHQPADQRASITLCVGSLLSGRLLDLSTQYDEMCAGLPYDENYDCTVVFATDGWSYLSFPEPDYCCKCVQNGGGGGSSAWSGWWLGWWKSSFLSMNG